MADKDKEAYWKGYREGRKPEKSPLQTLIHGTHYNPPEGRVEPYRQGFKEGEKERKNR